MLACISGLNTDLAKTILDFGPLWHVDWRWLWDWLTGVLHCIHPLNYILTVHLMTWKFIWTAGRSSGSVWTHFRHISDTSHSFTVLKWPYDAPAIQTCLLPLYLSFQVSGCVFITLCVVCFALLHSLWSLNPFVSVTLHLLHHILQHTYHIHSFTYYFPT